MTVRDGMAIAGAPSRERLERVWSPQLGNRRHVDVYLPASYGGSSRHPVVYMHDGQNLSDPAEAFAGTWQLDDTLRRMAAAGIEPIVVGVHNTDHRLSEYSPFPDPRHGGGQGDAYVAFLADTLRPRIDRLFRTERTAARTAIVGSSMGGLVSLFAWFRRPDVFALAGAMSPSLWYGRDQLFDYLMATAPQGDRLYVDTGTEEGGGTLRDARRLRALVRASRFSSSAAARVRALNRRAAPSFAYQEDRGARHEEAAWAGRLEGVLRFLLGP
jgi:predicted alpha/beta superfamily hydrolase